MEPGDGIVHFQISQYAFKYPENFFKHWGKPLFTLLSAPFAQLGYIGMIIFNLTVFSISSYFLFNTAKKLELPMAGLAPFILMSSMVYFKMVNAGMTEILMAALCIASIHYVVTQKYLLAAIIASMSIVARPESIVLIPLVAVLLAWQRQWRFIPWLSLGFIFFSLLGFFVADKSLGWIIAEDPYPLVSPYGSGDLTRFFGSLEHILGYFIFPLMAIGVTSFVRKLMARKYDQEFQIGVISLLIVLLVMLLHTYLWWKGLKGSLGLIRVIASVIPLAALVSMMGLSALLRIRKVHPATILFALPLLVLGDIHAYNISHLPRMEYPREKTILKVAEWYSETQPQGKIAYYDPYFSFVLNLDPYDMDKAISLIYINKKDPTISLDPGDIILWDSQYGPREVAMPKTSVTENKNIRVIKELKSQFNYEIIIAEVIE